MRCFIRFGISAALLNSLASAISIISPVANSTYAAGSSVTVKWTTVDTDPSVFSLYLWNFVSWPPSYIPLATDIPTADESHTVQIPCDTNPEWGYQGERFTVAPADEGEDCVDPVPVPEPSPSETTCGATTVYVTVSPTASSSPTRSPSPAPAPSGPHHHHHHHHHHNHPPRPSSATTPTATATTSSFTKPGNVPKTIGWCSEYSHPVTLDRPPVPTAPVPTAVPEEGSGGLSTVVTTVTVAVPTPVGDDRCLAV
ncbi:hypothetical protein BJX70DRAFT_395778 [Aspergillus crustosus]